MPESGTTLSQYGNEMADEIAKSFIRLATEIIQETLKSLKTIPNKNPEGSG